MQQARYGLDRREMMRRALYIVGGAAAVSAFGANAALAADTATPFFSAPRRARLEAMVDLMIPKTDTPGALDAGVPDFIDGMMTNWASTASQWQIMTVVDGIDAFATAQEGAPFLSLPPARRANVMQRYDQTSLGASNAGYIRFRQLVMVGYYLSQPGATVELRYEQVPGAWHADIPFSDIGREWAV